MNESISRNWDELLQSVQRSRDARAKYFKPACLFAVCSLLDRSTDGVARFPAQAIIKEFEVLVEPVFPAKAGNGWMPLWHLSSDGAWACFKGEVRTPRTAFPAGKPKSRRQLLSAVDCIELPDQLLQQWHHKGGREELKRRLIHLLRADNDQQANVAGEYFARLVGIVPDALSANAAQRLLQELAAIQGNTDLSPTSRQQLVDARLGQGRYRQELEKIFQGRCAVTGLGIRQLLRASHILAWKDASDAQRVDPNNGLLLSANLDALFDQHLVTFDRSGRVRISRSITSTDLPLLGPLQDLRAEPTPEQWHYLRLHNDVFDGLDRCSL